jgi:dephospho-CoA kinase
VAVVSQPLRIGLTGGIGSGKSTVARILQELGCAVVDADAISRATTGVGGRAIADIALAFGPELIDSNGALDRIKMRELVFADPSAKGRLEAIIHPLVHQTMQAHIAAASAQRVPHAYPAIVLDLPLLAEKTGFNGWRSRLDQVWVVDCSEKRQVDRVMARNGLTEVQIRAVMDNQATRAQRRQIADVVITNEDVTLQGLKAAIMTASHFLR